jgi:hypothetical protein
MTRESKIALMTTVILAGFIAAVGFHYLFYPEAVYPYNTFLFRPGDRFNDFLGSVYRIALNPYRVLQSNYSQFPFDYFVGRIFTLFDPIIAFGLILSIYAGSFIDFCIYYLKVPSKLLSFQNTIIVFLSYPCLMALDRANLTFLGFIFVVIFLILYLCQSKWALLFLALAISLKITNGVFLILILADKKYRDMIVTGLATGLITLCSYAILPGGIILNIKGNLTNLHLYTITYVMGDEGLFFGHSLFGAIKYLYIVFNQKLLTPQIVTGLMQPYLYVVVILFCAIVVYIFFIEKVLWRKLLLLVLPMLLFPYVSADYNLLYIFLPLFYLINHAERSSWDWFYMILLALLIIPKDYFRLNLLPEVNMAALVNPLIMLAVLGVTILRGLVYTLQGRKPMAISAVELKSTT